MKLLTKTTNLLLLILILPYQLLAFELTKDNPKTLIGTNSSEYTINGIKLGMTHNQARYQLQKNISLIGVKDKNNPSRIYVYSTNKNGNKDKAVFYLIWKPKAKELKKIVIYQDYRSSLSKMFRHLLTFEAIDNNSKFKRKFIGYANKSRITLDIPSIDLKHTTYFYDDIGIEITKKHSSDEETVNFCLSQP